MIEGWPLPAATCAGHRVRRFTRGQARLVSVDGVARSKATVSRGFVRRVRQGQLATNGAFARSSRLVQRRRYDYSWPCFDRMRAGVSALREDPYLLRGPTPSVFPPDAPVRYCLSGVSWLRAITAAFCTRAAGASALPAAPDPPVSLGAESRRARRRSDRWRSTRCRRLCSLRGKAEASR